MCFIDHEPAEIDDEEPRELIVTVNHKRTDNQSSDMSIDMKYNAPSSKHHWFDSENLMTKEQLLRTIEMGENGEHIENAISNYHDQRPGPQNELRAISTKEKGHFAWRFDYQRCPKNGGLLLKNEKLIQEQRRVIMNLIKRVGSNLMQGKSIMSISMPVTIFDKTSFLQRISKSMGFGPHFLRLAGETNDIYEQIKYVAAFFSANFTMNIMQGN